MRGAEGVVRDVLVPQDLLRDPSSFGGSLQGDCLRGDLRIRDGRAATLVPAPPTADARFVIPALVETHCHLDKCHTIDRLGVVGGDLKAAIAAQEIDKALWTAQDIERRARRGLEEAVRAGCATLRTHVDWGPASDPPTAWGVLTELARSEKGMALQCAALTGIDQMSDPGFCRTVAGHVAASGGVLGAFLLDHEMVRAGLRNMFENADRLGLALDFHVDEALNGSNHLEAIADTAIETGFRGPILCGHAVSLMDHPAQVFARIAEKLARAGISVCALPATNLYLQGRVAHATPDRRGLTRLRELRAAGVAITLGSDNVADAFCPVGRHDPMAALHLGVLTAHLDLPMGQWLDTVTTSAATAVGVAPVHVDGAETRQLLICSAGNTADLVAGRAPLLPLRHALEERSE